MKSIEEAKKSVQLKRDLLKYNYGKQFREWNGKYFDDRQVFCNIYSMNLEALEVMETIDNTHIWVAFNRQFQEDRETLDNIKAVFCDK